MKVSTHWLYIRLHWWLARLAWWTQQDTSDKWSENGQFYLCSSPAHNHCSHSPLAGTAHRMDNPLVKDRITLKLFEFVAQSLRISVLIKQKLDFGINIMK